MTADDYTLDDVITFMKARKEELNRQNVNIMAAYDEVDKLLEHFEDIKKQQKEE